MPLAREDFTTVTERLLEAGVAAKFLDDDSGGWVSAMEVDGVTLPVMLFYRPGTEYFICVAPIRSAGLKVALSNMKRANIEQLIRLNSAVRLAKLEYQEIDGKGVFYAVSDCSVDGYTGSKLRARMLACATLAATIQTKIP